MGRGANLRKRPVLREETVFLDAVSEVRCSMRDLIHGRGEHTTCPVLGIKYRVLILS